MVNYIRILSLWHHEGIDDFALIVFYPSKISWRGQVVLVGVLGEDRITYFGGCKLVSTSLLCFSHAPVLMLAFDMVGHGVSGLINDHHHGAGTIAFMITVITLCILMPLVSLYSLFKWKRWRLAQFEGVMRALSSAPEPRLGLV